MAHGELALWEPLNRLYEHRDGGAPYSLKLEVTLQSGLTQKVLVQLSETELRISCALDGDRAAFADQIFDMRNSEFKVVDSEREFWLTQSINHLDENWSLFTDFNGQLASLAAHAASINGELDANEPKYEYVVKQEVESP